ncbi:MAG: PD-(D/E)XK nuclease family protein [Verrucomicrobiota bacterium]
METRFLLGPAGSGKTFNCLADIRAELAASAEGDPLILLAPKQATFQLERQLLADPSLPGYTRLRISSFERLAEFILERLQISLPQLLSEEGRVMVLRALLAEKRDALSVFRASARLPGFAQQLSLLLRELQRYHLLPERLARLSGELGQSDPLGKKLRDLALLLDAYLEWLRERGLQDTDRLLDLVTEALQAASKTPDTKPKLMLAGLWLDGFAEMTPQELDLLAALAPFCKRMTLAFCLEHEPKDDVPWLSTWSVVSHTFRRCLHQLQAVPRCDVVIKVLRRDAQNGRFTQSPVLCHLEKFWTNPSPFRGSTTGAAMKGGADARAEDVLSGVAALSPLQAELEFSVSAAVERAEIDNSKTLRERKDSQATALGDALGFVTCANPEAEAVFAAREILRFVRAGGRFRDVAVLVRQLDNYHDVLRRTFNGYGIPAFIDRRESVAHHPLAELTRFALRTVAFGWTREDWFGALKTGLLAVDETKVDWLENEALARGWEGKVWQEPIRIPGDESRADALEQLRQKLVPPFLGLADALRDDSANARYQPDGAQLAAGLRSFWQLSRVNERLKQWSAQSPSSGVSPSSQPASQIHAAIWQQMHEWLENIERAFADRSMPLRDWLPILEAGLAGLTVGVVPPALDQVLIGTIDRSRNPDLHFALVLGMNESVFPAPPAPPNLLTEDERETLALQGAALGLTPRLQIGHERYYGYIACTRARRRLLLTCSVSDAQGRRLNPSPFLAHLQTLFPTLKNESFSVRRHWLDSEHVSELVPTLVRSLCDPEDGARDAAVASVLSTLESLPAVAALRQRLEQFRPVKSSESLSPILAGQLYGKILRTSVGRVEKFAACPFKFFVDSGLRAEERKRFELDVRERGSFQHEILAQFHRDLQSENKEWRDITPAEARERIEQTAARIAPDFRDGLLEMNDQSRFTTRYLTGALQNFAETIIGWMKTYQFNPRAVELSFGLDEGGLPAWEIDLGEGRRLAFRGKIDRVDLWTAKDGRETFCVVMDYKSSSRTIDAVLLEHGIQLQLPAYLSVLRNLPDLRSALGVERLIPAGVFYVNLRGSYARAQTRQEALAGGDAARARAFQHTGRFDSRVLRLLDSRPNAKSGEQFVFRVNKDGQLRKGSPEALESEKFDGLLDAVEEVLKKIGREIFAGVARVDPFRKGQKTACDHCDYRSICRIDPWTHVYRVLRKPESAVPNDAAATDSD